MPSRNLFWGDAKTRRSNRSPASPKRGRYITGLVHRHVSPESGILLLSILWKLVQRTVWENLDGFKWLKLKFKVLVIKFLCT